MADIQLRPAVPDHVFEPGDFVYVEEGRFTGCILDLVECQGKSFVCTNNTFGGITQLADGSLVNAIRTRKVSLYLSKADVARRIAGEHVVGHESPRVAAARAAKQVA